MQTILGRVASIDRPSLLIRAARSAADEYRRDLHLPRILKAVAPPRIGDAILRLIDIEAELDRRRTEDSADYSFARHIDVLIALMGEVRLYTATRKADSPERPFIDALG